MEIVRQKSTIFGVDTERKAARCAMNVQLCFKSVELICTYVFF